MKAIELRQALIEANDINLNGADALVETTVLKQLIESCKARIEKLEPEAQELTQQILADLGETSGKFPHEGHHYTLDCVPVFDIVGKPQKYTMPEAVTYRQKAAQQTDYKKQSAILTKEMKAIMDVFPITHPNIKPDELKSTLKCLD